MTSHIKLAITPTLLLIVFTINVCIGKYRVWSGTGTSAPLDGVPEFIILLAAVGFFIIIVLAAEKRKNRE